MLSDGVCACNGQERTHTQGLGGSGERGGAQGGLGELASAAGGFLLPPQVPGLQPASLGNLMGREEPGVHIRGCS